MTINIFWHRRDLRLQDNAGLYHALKSACPVLSLFIFDDNIFIYKTSKKIQNNIYKEREIHDVVKQLPEGVFCLHKREFEW